MNSPSFCLWQLFIVVRLIIVFLKILINEFLNFHVNINVIDNDRYNSHKQMLLDPQ